MKKIDRQYLYIGTILLLAFSSFWFVFPIYTFDSFWYISYLDYFLGVKPMNEWNSVRGFVFPLILWISYLIQPNSWGIEITLCGFYMIFSIYILKLFIMIKKECFEKKLNIGDCIIIGMAIILNPIIWGYAHLVLTEIISVCFLILYSYYALKFFFRRRKHLAKTKEHILFLVFSCIMTSILWFLKQSFFANTIIIATVLEFGLIVYRLHVKKIIYMLLLIISMVLSIKIPTKMWYDIIEVSDNAFAGGLAGRICCLRYFYPENENIHSGYKVKVSVMNDCYEVIDNFDYTFEDGLKRLNYIWECLKKNPSRVAMGYIDNYMLMSNVFQSPLADDGGVAYAYGRVIRDKPIQTIMGNMKNMNLAGEHRMLVQAKIRNGYNSLTVIEDSKELLSSINAYSDIMEQYKTINNPNIISKIMCNKIVWNMTMIWYAILLLGAPVVLGYSFIRYLIDKNKTVMLLYTMFSAYALGLIMMHVLTGQPIDRYAFPAYVAMLIVLVIGEIKIYNWVLKSIRKDN